MVFNGDLYFGHLTDCMRAASLGGGHRSLASKEQQTPVKRWGSQRMLSWPYFLYEALWLQITLFLILGWEPKSKPSSIIHSPSSTVSTTGYLTWWRQDIWCTFYVLPRTIIHLIWIVLKHLGGTDPAWPQTNRDSHLQLISRIDDAFPLQDFPLWTNWGLRHRLWIFNDFDFPFSN